MDNDELLETDGQIILSIISIGTILVSILLLYNNYLRLNKRTCLLNKKEEYYTNLFNKVILIIVVFLFFYISYKNYLANKNSGKNILPYELQVYASILTLAAAVIVLYIAFINRNNIEIEEENPLV